MEQTTGETRVQKTQSVSAEEKSLIFFKGSFFSTYKIPLLSLLLFALSTLRALYPETFTFGFQNHRSYKFNTESLGFFIGDAEFFRNNSQDEAESQLIGLFPQKLQKKVKKVIRPVLILSEKHKLDPFWVLSILWTESNFKHESQSKKGAQGLMQLMPETYMETLALMKSRGVSLESDRAEEYLRYHYDQVFYELGRPKLVSKLRNLEVGIYYLKGLFETFNNNYHYATVAYNMGPSWTKNQLKNNLPVGVNNNYLNKVLTNYFNLTRALGQTSNVTFIPRI